MIEVIKWKASTDDLVFPEKTGSMELITYYSAIQKSLTSVASTLKDSQEAEKRDEEMLNIEAERLKRQK